MKIYLIILILILILILIYFKFKSKCSVVILLTCTVNVQNNINQLKLTDSTLRKDIYLKSIKQWIKTPFKIVVVENSGYNFPELKQNSQLEIISFMENEIYPELSNEISKGTHELYSINYAIEKSNLIKQSDFIIKVTGRYFIPNFDKFNFCSYQMVTQKNPLQCEVIGCKTNLTDILFNKKLNYINNEYNSDFIEILYQRRTNGYKILSLPPLKIEPTINGTKGIEINWL